MSWCSRHHKTFQQLLEWAELALPSIQYKGRFQAFFFAYKAIVGPKFPKTKPTKFFCIDTVVLECYFSGKKNQVRDFKLQILDFLQIFFIWCQNWPVLEIQLSQGGAPEAPEFAHYFLLHIPASKKFWQAQLETMGWFWPPPLYHPLPCERRGGWCAHQ